MTTNADRADVLTNPRAQRVKAVRALGRRSMRERTGRFVAEGPQAVREAVAWAPHSVLELFVEESAQDRHHEIVQKAHLAGVAIRLTDADVLAAMADTGSPQGLLAVCAPVDRPAGEVVDPQARLVVVLTHVRDPGNAGTVIRCADAAGADAVILCGESVDLYNPKVVRATAGSLWHVPVGRAASVEDTLAACRAAGLRLLAADGSGDRELAEVDLGARHAWVMGNEAWGLEAHIRQQCDEVVRVPIYGHAESLNLAMAATVCLYAAAGAQRRR